jgi:hypothetical protein
MDFSPLRFLLGLATSMVLAPLAVFWTMSVHEPHCAWGEAFWNGDLPVGEGMVEGLILGSSRSGTDWDLDVLAEETGVAWQRIARHTLTGNALPPSYPALVASSLARPGRGALVIEVSPLLFDEASCARPPIPHIPMRPAWLVASAALGLSERPSALAMSLLPHRWLAGSGRRHDLVEHAKSPAHLVSTIADLRHLRRHTLSRWPGEPAPELTEANAWNRREFLLGGPVGAFVPKLNAACMASLARTVQAVGAERTFLVMLPMRPMLRDTIEADYQGTARIAFGDLARSLPRTAFVDLSTRFDDDVSAFNDFDHLTAAGAATFTREQAERLR